MKEFVSAVAARTGMSEERAREFIKAVISEIADTLGREAILRLPDFGTFEVRLRAPRVYRNPRTGDRIEKPAQNHLGFSAATAFKERVDRGLKERFDQQQMPLLEPEDDAVTIDVDAVREAAERLRPWVHTSPVLTSRTLDARCGGSVFLKCENFQKVGEFKFRGAMNALLQLSDAEAKAGVVTHSSGNHAQALARAGQLLGIPVCVVMPRTAPAIKRAATEGYGARIVPCEPTLAARETTVADLIARHGYTLIHPFDDWRVIAGQGTAAWELLDQAGPLDLVICPVGGGGLLAGTTLAVKGRAPGTKVIGVEPERADDARRSLETGSIQPSGDPKTIADGLRTSLGPRPFSIIAHQVDAIVTATEAEIIDAMRFVWERFKIIIEPSSAVPVAPVLTGRLAVKDRRVGIILSGGNVDLEPMFQSLVARWVS